MSLAEYIDQIKKHEIIGGKHPWYIFHGYAVGKTTDVDGSPVRLEYMPTPPTIDLAFDMTLSKEKRGLKDVPGREARYASAQWGVGGEGTGSPVHFHGFAW
jgi:hypothetical protein